MSKGSGRRPGKNYASNYDAIFAKKWEHYEICAYCMAEDITHVGPDAIAYCGSCETIVEGNTLKCKRELDNAKS